MSVPCRTGRSRKRVRSLCVVIFFALGLEGSLARAASYEAASTPQPGATSQVTTTANPRTPPFEITAGVDLGYDDNVIGSSSTNSNGQASFFTRENLVLTRSEERRV